MTKINIFWFRRDLRLNDNRGLHYCNEADLPFLPIFIFDTAILNKLEDKADARVQFIHNTLATIKEKLQNKGSDLRIYYGDIEEIWEKITQEFSIQGVYTNEDYEPSAIKRDFKVEKLLKKKGITFHSYKDQCIFAKEDILKKDGNPYTVYTPYKNAWLSHLTPKDLASIKAPHIEKKCLKLKKQKMITLQKMGFQKTEVSNQVRSIKRKIINEYKGKRDFPGLDATSYLGLHLRFGTVSVRKCAQIAFHSEDHTWLSELIWREFFMQILYHFPHVEKKSFKEKYDGIKWINNKKEFKKWCEGKTGYPLVDAGMRQLNETGFMHNRVRMVAASFLIKHLLIDWRLGEKYFAKKLLDFDLSANNGNWQWVAGCGCDAAPYFRIFNPQTQLEKFDPDLIYVKKWVSEFGTDQYPEPMVGHKSAYQRALMTYKLAVK